MNELIEKIEIVCGVNLAQMKRRSRKRYVCFARTILAYEMRFTYKMTVSEIGLLLNRNYTSVCNMTNKSFDNYQQYSEFVAILHKITNPKQLTA